MVVSAFQESRKALRAGETVGCLDSMKTPSDASAPFALSSVTHTYLAVIPFSRAVSSKGW